MDSSSMLSSDTSSLAKVRGAPGLRPPRKQATCFGVECRDRVPVGLVARFRERIAQSLEFLACHAHNTSACLLACDGMPLSGSLHGCSS